VAEAAMMRLPVLNGLDFWASALLTGKAHIRALTIAEIDIARSSTTPFIDYLKVPLRRSGIYATAGCLQLVRLQEGPDPVDAE